APAPAPAPALDPRLLLQVVGRGMTGLVEREISTARKLDGSPQPPAHVPHRVRDRDALGRQIREGHLKVRAHQVEFLLRLALRRVHRSLCWRQLEDQPALSGVDSPKSQHISQEDPVGLWIATVEHDMGAAEHGLPSRSFSCYGPPGYAAPGARPRF